MATTTTAEEATQTFRIVLISDLHRHGRRLNQITEWVLERNARIEKMSNGYAPTEWINALLCLGDIGDLPPNCQDPTLIAAELGICSSSFVIMSNIAPKIVYVPGNHDPIPMFNSSNPPCLSISSINAYKRWVRLGPGIVVCGLGGTGPAQLDSDAHSPSGHSLEEQVAALQFDSQYSPSTKQSEDIPPEFATLGYPWLDNGSELGTAPIPVSEVDPGESVILLSHEGPAGSSTTTDFGCNDTEAPLAHGSEVVAELIRKGSSGDSQRHIVAAVHGSAHNSAGMATMGNVKIINPGALCEGSFSLLTLEKSPGDELWHVSDCRFIRLPDLPPLIQVQSTLALNN